MFIVNYKLSNALITYGIWGFPIKYLTSIGLFLFPCVLTPAKNLTMQGHPEPEVT